MSAEIKVNISLSATKDSFSMPKYGGETSVNMAVAAGGVPGLVLATNAAQGVNIGTSGLIIPGWCFLKNLDAVAYIDFGPVIAGTLQVMGRMLPGESAGFRYAPGVTIAVKSSDAESPVQALVLDS